MPVNTTHDVKAHIRTDNGSFAMNHDAYDPVNN